MEKPTIFISHISQEKEIACVFKEFLGKKFLKIIDVFASSHEESLRVGDDWMNTIKMSMMNCKLLIIICSPISISRPWINFEAGAGWIKEVPVIPLCHSGLTPNKLPVPVNSFQGGILNNQDDMRKVFNRIANLLSIDAPKLDDDSFFAAIKSFEVEIRNSILTQDTTFVYNLLNHQIEILKYCIYSSVFEYEKMDKVDLRNFRNLEFNFNDTYNLFNIVLLMIHLNKKVSQLYYEIIHKINDDIKFVLTYSRIEIAPELKELFNEFLFSVIKVEVWYDGIERMDKQTSSGLREMSISMIKEEPLPPQKRFSNTFNYFIDYYESLIYFKNWVVKYEIQIYNLVKIPAL